MQNCGMAPPFGTWAEGLRTQTVREDRCFGPKNRTKFEWRPFFLVFIWFCAKKYGLNLSERRPFFFWSSSDFGQENRTDFGWKIFYSDPCYSQIFWISGEVHWDNFMINNNMFVQEYVCALQIFSCAQSLKSVCAHTRAWLKGNTDSFALMSQANLLNRFFC